MLTRLLLCFFLPFVRVFADSGINLNIEREVSVSGISSGGYMAAQFFMSHSSTVKGVGIVAAGPFLCSNANAFTALYGCMRTFMRTPSVPSLIERANSMAKSGKIDSLENVKESKVYVFAGTIDTVVHPKLTLLNRSFFEQLGVAKLTVVDDFPAGHTFPTLGHGSECSSSQKPWIGNCAKDVAGEILTGILDDIKERAGQEESSFYRFKQPHGILMAREGVAYIPKACVLGEKCKLHLALHGCSQGEEVLGDEFYKNAGYNQWAQKNHLVIVYPQVEKGIANPSGCWDWWGYGGPDFASKSGSQVSALNEIVDSFKNSSLLLKPVFPF